MTGTLINVGAVLAGTAVGVAVGPKLRRDLPQRVLAGLGLVTAVIGVDLPLAWRSTSALHALGAILLGGMISGRSRSRSAWGISATACRPASSATAATRP